MSELSPSHQPTMPETSKRATTRTRRRTAAARQAPRLTPPHRSAPDERFCRQIIGSMRNGIIAIRRNGSMALMNDEAYRILAMTRRPDDIGRPFTEVLRERLEASRSLAGAFNLSHLANRSEFQVSGRVVGYTLSCVRDEHGDTAGAVMFFKDLTQVEQVEERERLRDRLAALGEMAAGMAHELKNPLAGIQITAGLLSRKLADSADLQAMLADIMTEARLANAIVVQLLEFVRPIQLRVCHTSLVDILQQSLMLAEAKAEKGAITFSVTVQPDLPDINVDPYQLSQVFINLLTNAFEAMNGHGAIVITAAADSREEAPTIVGEKPTATPIVVVDVTDNGPGMPSDVTDRIFVPFFTTKPEGSGLGLPIVRKIVVAHDGRIDVTSSETGTRFRITLPIGTAINALPANKD